MVLLDLGDTSWAVLVIVVVLALVGVGLYLSLRRQLRRIDIPDDRDESRPAR